MRNNPKLRRLVMLALLSAVGVVLTLFSFPVIPATPFLRYDAADITILIGSFLYGVPSGLLMTVTVSVLQGLTTGVDGGVYGVLMHIIATGTLVTVSGLIYRVKKTRPGALLALAAGALAMVAVMMPANLLITPYFMTTTREVVWSLMPGILAFNAFKAGVNALVTFVVYKRVGRLLRADEAPTLQTES